MGLFGVYITYEQQEGRSRREGQGEAISTAAITKKNRLAEMVAETKKKILQGALTVSPSLVRKHMTSCISSSLRRRINSEAMIQYCFCQDY